MKGKILSILIVLILFPTTAWAYVDYYRDYKIFQSGLSPLIIETEKFGEEDYRYFTIKGPGFEKTKLNEDWAKIILTEDSAKIYIQKRTKWNDYQFWKLNGQVGEKPFSIIGMTLEGDFLENGIAFQSLLVLLVTGISIFVYKKLKTKKQPA